MLRVASRAGRSVAAAAAAAAAAPRGYSTAVPHKKEVLPGTGNPERKKVRIFNRSAKLEQRNRFAKVPREECKLHAHIADIVIERLSYVQREFPVVLELGCGRGHLSEAFLKSNPRGLKKYIQCDSSQAMLDDCFERTCAALPKGVQLEQYCIDEDGELPFDRRSVDLCVSMLSMHWVNDIESTFRQVRNVLKRDGVVFVSVFGGRTLSELQSCFTVAEQERDGGVSPHINPFLTGPSMADLLQNSGYNFPTVDVDRFNFQWETAFHLMEYLRMIGESNVLVGRRPFLGKDALIATAAVYEHLWADEKGMVPSTFEIVHGVGWAPHPSHAEPSARGAGHNLSLKDIAEALGEDLITEEQEGGVVSSEVRREKLEAILRKQGVNVDQLRSLTDKMEKRLDGDSSRELENEILDLRQQIQGSYDRSLHSNVQRSLPTAERAQKLKAERKLIDQQRIADNLSKIESRDEEIVKKMMRQGALSDPHGRQ